MTEISNDHFHIIFNYYIIIKVVDPAVEKVETKYFWNSSILQIVYY